MLSQTLGVGCGSVSAKSFGYGVIARRGQKDLLAHRVSWEKHYGLIPDGMNVLHKCDTPPCVNPAHLFLGTRRDNVHDMIRKGRAVLTRGGGPIGEISGRSKLTEKDVFEIRRQLEGGISGRAIAKLFGVCSQSIFNIKSGRTWGWLAAGPAQLPIARPPMF